MRTLHMSRPTRCGTCCMCWLPLDLSRHLSVALSAISKACGQAHVIAVLCPGVLPMHVYLGMQIRAAVKKQNAGKYATKVKARSKRKQHVAANPAPRDE